MIETSGNIYSLIIFIVSMIWFINHPDSWEAYETEPADTPKGRNKKK